MNFVPNGWQRCVLSDFTRIVMGQSPSSETYNKRQVGLPFFQGKAEFGELYPTIRKYCSRPRKVASKGATLLAIRAPVGPTNLAQQECCIGRGLAAIHPYKEIDPKLVLYLLRSVEPSLSNKGTGSTFAAISKDFIESLEFNLPPLAEQHRIVAKIEELLSELDKGIDSLKTAQTQLNIYRQTVLKHAFEGKLTAQWREENKDKLKRDQRLLVRIRNERDASYQQKLKAWKAACKRWEESGKTGNRPTKPRILPKLTDLSQDQVMQLPSLPNSWAWAKLGWTTCGVEYGTSVKSAKQGKVPVLRMGNIQDAKLDWSDLVYTSSDDEIDRLRLRNGDVLFNRTNSPELVGKTAIYRGERPAIFAGYLIRINHIQASICDQYLNLFLNSPVARQHGNSVKTDGVNQSNISGTKLLDYPFPYCLIEEQREVASRLEEALSVIENTEDDLGKVIQNAATLRQAILRKAFSGELVEQYPEDEPASVLLERIEAEIASRKAKSRWRRLKVSGA